MTCSNDLNEIFNGEQDLILFDIYCYLLHLKYVDNLINNFDILALGSDNRR